MREIINLYWQICQFKKGPQDLPESIALYGLSITCYLIAGLLLTKLNMAWGPALVNMLIGLMLLWGFIWGLLQGYKKPERFYPTATALFGVDAFITVLSLPFFAAVVAKLQPGVAFLFLVLLMIWHWAVMANIIRLALSTSIAIGLLWATLFHYGSYQLITLISGAG